MCWSKREGMLRVEAGNPFWKGTLAGMGSATPQASSHSSFARINGLPAGTSGVEVGLEALMALCSLPVEWMHAGRDRGEAVDRPMQVEH